MTTYDFHPFVTPSNTGKIVFPNYDTIMKAEDVVLEVAEKKEEEEQKEDVNIDDLALDFEKLKISRGRQTKTTGGYSHEKLKELGKELKRRGKKIDMKSKNGLIDSMLLLQ